MNVEQINEIIAKSLSHEASDNEMEILQAWLNQSEANRQQFEIIQHEWKLANSKKYKIVNGEELKEKIWLSSHAKVAESTNKVNWKPGRSFDGCV